MRLAQRMLGFIMAGIIAATVGLAFTGRGQQEELRRLPEEPSLHLSDPAQPLLKVVDDASAIIRGTVLAVDEPRWNSRDGRSWEIQFAANPGGFKTAPMLFTRVAVRVDSVLHSAADNGVAVGSDLSMEIKGDPSLSRAQTRNDVTIPWPRSGGYVDPGEQHIFFLHQTIFPYPDAGDAPTVWSATAKWGIWGSQPDIAIPGESRHQAEIESVAEQYPAVVLSRGEKGFSDEVLAKMARR